MVKSQSYYKETNHQRREKILKLLDEERLDFMENIQKGIDMTVIPTCEEITSTSYEGTYYPLVK